MIHPPKPGDFRSAENCWALEDAENANKIIEEEKSLLRFSTSIEEDLQEGTPSYKIYKTINALNLPILISDGAYKIIPEYIDDTKSAIVMLCDLLTYFSRTTATASDVRELYPFGFYKEEIVKKIIVGELMPGRHPWSHVFNSCF